MQDLQSSSIRARRRVPVARVAFDLSDRTAFDSALKEAIQWISRTCASELPNDANSGQQFDFTSPSGIANASALRVDDADGSIWAARVSYLGDKSAAREWRTELSIEQRRGEMVRFGAQLNCFCAEGDPGFEHSRPRVIRDVLDRLSAEADGEPIGNASQEIFEPEVESLVRLLYNPSRRLPVVVVSTDDHGGAQVDLDRLATRLSGAAHLRHLSIDPSYELSRLIGKRMSVFNGAIRIYMPGIEQENEDPFQHPLWLAPDSGWNPRIVGQIASRVLPLGFRDPDGDARFWKIGLLRQALSSQAAAASVGTEEEKRSAQIDALEAQNLALREAAESAEALMYEEAEKLKAAQAEISMLQDENFSLRVRIRSLKQATGSTYTSIDHEDIRSLFDGEPTLEVTLRVLGSLFPDRIVVLDSAFESARESHIFRHRKKAFDLVWELATSYWQALSIGESDGTARKCFGSSYAAKEAQTLSADGRRRRIFTFDGDDILMEKHLKIGVADNKADTLRIHFEWIANKRLIVIGHCGEHLDF